jgi:hypothetical protein
LIGNGIVSPGTFNPFGVIDTRNPSILTAEISIDDDGVTFPLGEAGIDMSSSRPSHGLHPR